MLDNISLIVEDAYEQLEAFCEEPFICFGHSMGAIVAFEFVKLLKKRAALAAQNSLLIYYDT